MKTDVSTLFNSSLVVISGPCVVENYIMLEQIAETLLEHTSRLSLPFIFKASYKKANRSSGDSFTGIGDIQALEYLAKIREKYQIPVLTDVHTAEEARLAAQYVDVLQIPAFLCRQTDLLIAAGTTGKPVNIKKGQFCAPDDMHKASSKVRSTGNNNVWLTERGTSFGYHDLVVDFRGFEEMKSTGCPLIYDATHSLQKPSIGAISGGMRRTIPALARAAVAAKIDGIFIETHPDPHTAKSDSATQMPLSAMGVFLQQLNEIHQLVLSFDEISLPE